MFSFLNTVLPVRQRFTFYSCFACLYLLLLQITGYAQEYNYVHYTTKDGLAGETVHGITQDRDGFIWFATETGVSRFDGKQFKNFTIEDGLPSNEMFRFYEDSKGRLWMVPFKNEVCYYYKGRIYNRYNSAFLKKARIGADMDDIWETPDGHIGLWDRNGHITLIDSLGEPEYMLAREADVLGQYAGQNGRRRTYLTVAQLSDTIRNILYTHYIKLFPEWKIIKNGDIYVLKGSGEEVAVIDAVRNISWFKQTPGLQEIRLADNNSIWVSTTKGGAVLYDFVHHKAVDSILTKNVIHDVFKDREGNTWYSTRSDGVFKLGKLKVVSYTAERELSPLTAVQFLIKKSGFLYASDDNGGFWKLEQNPVRSRGILPARLRKVSAGAAWLMGENENRFISYASSDFLDIIPLITRGAIKSLYLFNDTFLVADNSHAYLADLKNLQRGQQIAEIYNGRSTCAIRAGRQYYIGTLNGLYIYDKSGKLQGIPLRNRISYFENCEDGTLWVGTYDGGVFRLQHGKITGSVTQQRGGLSSNLCRCLFRSGHYLWVGTDKGINKIDVTDPELRVVTFYTTADGLSTDIINALYVTDSMVYVGTSKGLNCFNERQAPQHGFCNLQLTGIIVSGKNMGTDSVLVLAHKDNNIRFEFSGLSFLSGGNITYRYRLLGLHSSWRTTAEQLLMYPSLPSGKYILQIVAINKFGDVSPMRIKEFEILPMLPERWWFQAGIALLLILLIFLFINFRIRRVERREAEKRRMSKKLMEMEHLALRAQMNPHFIFNCLNSIQNHIIKKDTEGANFYLSRFAGLVRQTLDNASRIYITLEEEIAYLKNYLELERLQYGASFVYEIDTGPFMQTALLQVPNMIIQPFVENAIKHGFARMRSGGELSVRFSLAENAATLECRIEDNGPGIDFVRQHLSHKTHISKGMSITSERVAMLNKMSDGHPIQIHIEDRSKYGHKGTQVLILFPMPAHKQQNHL